MQNEQELVLAARQGNIGMVKLLIDSGVSVNAVDEFGMTPLMLLAAQGLDEGVRLLLDHPACHVNKRTSSMMVGLWISPTPILVTFAISTIELM